jgi:ATP-binding cassette subfamily B protein
MLSASTLIDSLLPAGVALTARGIVNAALRAFNGKAVTLPAVLPWLLAALALALLDVTISLWQSYLSQRLFDELNLGITQRILEHAARLDVSAFEDPTIQDVMDRAQENTAQHFTQFVTAVLAALTGMAQVVSLAAVLIVIEPILTLLIVPVFIPQLVFQWQLARRRFAEEHSRTTKRRWSRYFVSRLTGQTYVPEVKILDLAPLLIRRFRELMTAFKEEDRKLYLRGLDGGLLFGTLSTVAYFVAFGDVVLRAVGGQLTIGDVAIYGGSAARLRGSLDATTRSLATILEQALYVSNLREYLALEPQVRDHGERRPQVVRGGLALDHVTFTYPGTSVPAVSDITLEIRPGETLALVGENGAGKTTLVKLIARLYDPDRGRITLDGIDLREYALEALHAEIACVFQNFGRYEGSLHENIALGDWRRLLEDRARIEELGRLAQLEPFVRGLPQGYDTLVGRMFGEVDLSGGQWQKIAVARAFARDARVLILDEPTSNLDARAEFQLFSQFHELARGRTTVLVSHRFSTVRLANRIVVIDNGRIVEAGTHTELVAHKGLYANLFRLHQQQMQAGSAEA